MLNYACSPFAEVADILDDGCNCVLDPVEHGDLIEDLIDMASDALFFLSGRRITGRCETTVSVITEGVCGPLGFWGRAASNWGYGLGYGYVDDDPGPRPFGGQDVIELRGPKTSVEEVLIDGVPLATSEYGLLDRRYLYRVDGTWPRSTDLSKLVVRYQYGVLDFLTTQAAVELVCAMLSDVIGDGTGSLPAGVVAASIQGATVDTRQLTAEIERNTDHLPRIMRWLGVYAPDGHYRTDVWTPDLDLGWQLVVVGGPSGS